MPRRRERVPRNSVMQVDINFKVRLTTKIMKNKVRIFRSRHDSQQIKTIMERTFMLVPGRCSPLLHKFGNGLNIIFHTPKDNFLRVIRVLFDPDVISSKPHALGAHSSSRHN